MHNSEHMRSIYNMALTVQVWLSFSEDIVTQNKLSHLLQHGIESIYVFDVLLLFEENKINFL